MLTKEPALLFNGIAEIVRAAIPVLILFGIIHWDDQQIAAVMLLVGVMVGFLSTMLTRSQVVPTEKANAQIVTALNEPSTTSVARVIAKTEAQNS